MEVKLVVRTLDVFELFSKEGKPLSLTDMARALDVPMSSTLALVRTLVSKGYLYETRKRGGYFPTRKMLLVCQSIDAADQVLELVRPFLEELRNISQETAVLGKRQDGQVVYLDVVLSHQPIRYHALVGESRAAHTNSIGKAIISMLEEKEQKALLAKANWRALTSRTLTTREAFLQDMAQTGARGWSSNVGESVEDLAAVALPFQLASEWYAVSIVGPYDRMERNWDAHVETLLKTGARLRQAIAVHEGQ
ncbi:transcriptional regulator, IclR family, C-terminal domain protein [Bordetella bronchiseptica 980-2]|uniref:IclR family transcriptional regulator n=1 Tax=Bordetella genomosp. 6 TaxID=463024 RepID=A0ABX4F9V7_9BORD|nr:MULTISPECIES: IclR family transcriptional regulator [Bordetella]KAK66446.1 transcriptional regulator, IclR family, C-terminal domain protein [Bordetella bronchiseptica 980-2]KCV50867.1 transcriptional regulator, IclR family, C-terminal domain protein [Bordetella bronchiseptica 3E44]KCV62810.1 transcriptional regulator, IclR family, C-terminal domain protein [Bordetella bronchiseptica 99-R-0433]KCV65605.1 transcriptional regulator, IclR family, C-terminal domain protein [Bordetella bronchisep